MVWMLELSERFMAWMVFVDKGSSSNMQVIIVGGGLTDGAFHLELDEAFEFDAVLHWEFANEIVNKTVNGEAHCLGFGYAALHHVKNLFFIDFGDAGFVLDGVMVALNGDRRIGICTACWVNKEGIALSVIAAVF